MSSETLRTIRLYGPLGARFGRVHRLAVSSTSEAVRALCVVAPGFEKFLMNAKDNGLTFAVFNGKRNLADDQLLHPVGRSDIRIAPILIGSKSAGLFQTILGVALIVVGALTYNYGGQAGVSMGLSMMAGGATMTLGGVVQMVSPQTTTSNGSTSDTKSSCYFSGAVNSTTQGDPVPLAYGRIRVGSKVVSSGIYSEDQA